MVSEEEIKQAAAEALAVLGLDDVNFLNAVQHTMSYDFNLSKWSIQYEESGGQAFRVIINMAELASTGEYITVDMVRDEIVKKLREPREYIP